MEDERKQIYRPRITIDVPEDLYERSLQAFPWGIRNQCLLRVFEQVVAGIERAGPALAYAIANGEITTFGGVEEVERLRLFQAPAKEAR